MRSWTSAKFISPDSRYSYCLRLPCCKTLLEHTGRPRHSRCGVQDSSLDGDSSRKVGKNFRKNNVRYMQSEFAYIFNRHVLASLLWKAKAEQQDALQVTRGCSCFVKKSTTDTNLVQASCTLTGRYCIHQKASICLGTSSKFASHLSARPNTSRQVVRMTTVQTLCTGIGDTNAIARLAGSGGGISIGEPSGGAFDNGSQIIGLRTQPRR